MNALPARLYPEWPDRSRLRDRLIAAGVERGYADLLAVCSQYDDRSDVRGLVASLLGGKVDR